MVLVAAAAGSAAGVSTSPPSVELARLVSRDLGFATVSGPVPSGVIRPGALLVTDSAGRTTRHIGPRLPRSSRIDDATFLDRRHGWLVSWNLDDVGVSVYRTSDGGGRWKHVAVTAHSMAAGSVATIQFLDPKHGWLVNQQPTAPDASLYASTDGGASWRLVRRELEIAPVRFTSLSDAWQAGGPFARSVYHSADGGHTWKKVRLPVPRGRAVYDLPVVFGHLVLAPVSLLRRGGGELVVYASENDGRTWTLAGRLNVADGTRAGPPSVSIATPRAWWVAVYRSGGWHAFSTTNAGRTWRSGQITRVRAPAPGAVAPSIQAVDAGTAWFRFTVGERDGRLYGTEDGGRHWRRLRLS